MRYVDAFNHFVPKRYFEKMLELIGDHKDSRRAGGARDWRRPASGTGDADL
jgi:hypothetical protein